MMTRKRERGSVLVGAIAISVAVAMLLAVVLSLNNSTHRNVFAASNAEAALLLAEAGVNNELNLISQTLKLGGVNSTAPTKLSGEPYPGRKGSITGAKGNYWVFTSSDAAGTKAWAGEPVLYITANAVVDGSWRRVKIGSPNMYQSAFGTFAFFTVDFGNGTAPAVSLAGSQAKVDVQGVAGTNGRIQSGTGTITCEQAANYNTSAFIGTTVQYPAPCFNYPTALELPSVIDVAHEAFPSTASKDEPGTWSYIDSIKDNVGKIMMWKSGLSSTATLSPTNVTRLGYPTTGAASKQLTNKASGSIGTWATASFAPGSTTKRTLILQPGDYFFNTFTLAENANTELIIDNAGLTVAGGNPDGKAVRIWIGGSGGSSQDNCNIEVKLTNPDDTNGCRIYYGKDGITFKIARPSFIASGTVGFFGGSVYAVTLKKGGTQKGAQVSLTGGNSDNEWFQLTGGLVADRVDFSGRCRIKCPPQTRQATRDSATGVGFMAGYSEGYIEG